jgi:transposase-like protein
MDCPACNGTTIEQMGMLGNLLWFRCRSCGLEFNMENNEDKTTEEADLKKFRELLLDAEIALTEAIGIMKTPTRTTYTWRCTRQD